METGGEVSPHFSVGVLFKGLSASVTSSAIHTI